MKTQTLTDPRLEIANTLFEARAEITYALAMPITRRLLSPAQCDRLEKLLADMEGIESALEALAIH